ncbi:hypothetical protein TCAL_08853 [Tigriopus californicus]|uniref:TRAF3-interacting protein 1 n=1 Tax=Tigriopus californicus TaxID=6832 RepID=A0A553PTI3_TIGCA|nr:TRAF3-interacting protein 1-like [Tigriopus californicus]TRY80991.1 hypothetical protein TCAL_08853 [Tigriopus californicus]
MSVAPAVIKKTQESLGKYLSKPPLTEKLLARPPFRFLHDVICGVIKQNGIFKGLLDNKEMVSDNVTKDRDSKIKFLEKVIFGTSFAIGENLPVKAGKIVSGQEGDKTNELLQALGRILDEGIDTSEAVKRVKKGEKPGKSTGPAGKKGSSDKKGKENVPQSRRGSKGAVTGVKDKGGKSSQPSRESTAKSTRSISSAKPIETINEDSNEAAPLDENGPMETLSEEPAPPKNGHPEPEQDELITNGHNLDDQEESAIGGLEDEQNLGLEPQLDAPANNEPQEFQEMEPNLPEEDPDQHSMNERPRTSAPSARPRTSGSQRSPPVEPPEENAPEPSFPLPTAQGPTPRPGSAMRSARPRTGRLKSGRPPSARPAAPRLKDKVEIQTEEAIQARPQTGRVANVILAGDEKDDDDDGEEFLVEEKPKDDLDFLTENSGSLQADPEALQSGAQEHGGLVQQILETQKELEEKPKEKKGVEIERDSGLSDIGKRRDRESTQREVDKLRSSIQTLTRSANPLGKLMDFLQEDVDAMQRELETWKNENRRMQLDLKQEQAMTEKSIEPLKIHLADLEGAVQEQLDKISVIKSNIIRNEERIYRMITSIGTTSVGSGGGR